MARMILCDICGRETGNDAHTNIVLAVGNRSFDVCVNCLEQLVNTGGLPDFVNELVRARAVGDESAAMKARDEMIRDLRAALHAAELALVCDDNETSDGHWCSRCDDHVDRNGETRFAIARAIALADALSPKAYDSDSAPARPLHRSESDR